MIPDFSREQWMKGGYIVWVLAMAAQMVNGGNTVAAVIHVPTMLGLGAFVYGFLSTFVRALDQPRIRKHEVNQSAR